MVSNFFIDKAIIISEFLYNRHDLEELMGIEEPVDLFAMKIWIIEHNE